MHIAIYSGRDLKVDYLQGSQSEMSQWRLKMTTVSARKGPCAIEEELQKRKQRCTATIVGRPSNKDVPLLVPLASSRDRDNLVGMGT